MVDVRKNFKIITNNYLNDKSTELRVIEDNAEQNLYMMMIIGGVLLFLGIIW